MSCFFHAKIAKIRERGKEVLHDITVTLPKNSLTALVAPSGSGKSTVMELSVRFYDQQQGCIFFGGIPMDETAPESLMSHISMVFQDAYLFQDTIRNNIRFGKTDATDKRYTRGAYPKGGTLCPFVEYTGKHFRLEVIKWPFQWYVRY